MSVKWWLLRRMSVMGKGWSRKWVMEKERHKGMVGKEMNISKFGDNFQVEGFLGQEDVVVLEDSLEVDCI